MKPSLSDPLANLLAEHFVDHKDGIVAVVFFKSGAAAMGALRPARLKGGDPMEGYYELTCGMPMQDPGTGKNVVKLVSNFFMLDAVERIGFEVEPPRIATPKSIIIPNS